MYKILGLKASTAKTNEPPRQNETKQKNLKIKSRSKFRRKCTSPSSSFLTNTTTVFLSTGASGHAPCLKHQNHHVSVALWL
jgi:hypothetical protein